MENVISVIIPLDKKFKMKILSLKLCIYVIDR